MTSERSKPKKEVARFSEWFTQQILARYKLSLPEVAAVSGLLPQQIRDFKREKNLPSSTVLRKLVTGLKKKQVEVNDLVRLVALGVGLDEFVHDKNFNVLMQALPSVLEQRETNKRDNSPETICILTPTLGENVFPELLETTLNQMRNNKTEYFYFLPASHMEGQRDTVLRKTEALADGALEIFLRQTYFITAPDVLFLVRLRIENISLPSLRVGSYSVGPEDRPVLFDMYSDELKRVVDVIYSVVTNAQGLRARGQDGKEDVQISKAATQMQLNFILHTTPSFYRQGKQS